MKTVHLFLEDEQHERLVKVKGNMSWVEFVMQLVEEKNESSKGKV